MRKGRLSEGCVKQTMQLQCVKHRYRAEHEQKCSTGSVTLLSHLDLETHSGPLHKPLYKNKLRYDVETNTNHTISCRFKNGTSENT